MNPILAKQLVRRLADHGVECVIIGGYAALSHGSSLLTQDIDVACRMTPENLAKLEAALAGLHPVHRMTPQKLPLEPGSLPRGGWKNVYLQTDWGQLDCLGEVAGVGGYDAVFARSEEIDLGDFRLRILGLDALIDAKRAAGRPKDFQAVYELEAIRALRKRGD
jgi:hypothetical protein